jgi:hypothetical protein
MEIGLSPKDIDIVVLTRINQAANIDLFPQARIIIQKKEWEHALNSMQFRPFVKKLENSRLYLADDGYQVSEGVRLISVPGYSEGQQAVVVDTTAGPYVLAGGLTHALAYIDQTAYITDIFGRRIACTTASDLDFKQAIIYTDLEAWNNIITHIFKKVSGCQRIISSYDPDLTEKVLPERSALKSKAIKTRSLGRGFFAWRDDYNRCYLKAKSCPDLKFKVAKSS